MRDLRSYPLLLSALVLAAAALVPETARAAAEENLLHGPHPFLRDNEISVHALIGEGQGDALSGAKLELEYGYKLTGGRAPWWLNLLISFEHSGCNPTPNAVSNCPSNAGDIVETMAGVKWKLATPLPIVPFAKANAGLVFAFPNGATDAQGLALRGAVGANYFFFDWLGLGLQVGFSVGRIDYDSTFIGSHTYAVVDFGGGVEFQF
ncbi:MAG TPA: hypothetical protein VKZ18_14615 [Polyangia bacterium]|nr:hypothetical protein [Polyangia bacterium]